MRQAIVSGLVGAFALAAAGTASSAADLVILESNVAEISAGSLVPEAQVVNLSSDAKLVMIAADGSTRTVTGPYSGVIGEGASDAPGALQRLTASREGADHVVGAIRAPSWEMIEVDYQ